MLTRRCIDRRLAARILSLLSPVLLTVILSCSGESGPRAIRLALQTEPSTIDPAYAVDYSSGMLVSLTHSNLVTFDASGRISPDLADSWSVSSDGLVYTFHLGRSRFSGGREVLASDVVFSFRRLIDPETLSPRWWVLEDVRNAGIFHRGGSFDASSLRSPDDSTVVIELEKPVAHFLSLLSMPAAAIVDSSRIAMLGRDYGRDPAGSGPWKISIWNEGDGIVLERNTGSHRFNREITSMSLRILPESMTRIAEFEIGNLDILDVPRAELDRWRSAGVTLLQQEELSVVYIGLNNDRQPFSDIRVRRALNMAIDVETILARVLFGAGRRSCGPVPSALKNGETDEDLYRYDPEGAAALLSEAGYPDGFTMEIWQRENPEAGRILESIQAYLGKVGVTVSIVTREWSAFKQAVDHGTPDAFYLDWYADYPDAENFLVPLFHSSNRGGGGNRAGYVDAVVDSLLDTASVTTGAEERLAIYRTAERRIYSDAPWIFLWFPVRYEVVSYRLKDYDIPVIFNSRRFTDVRFE